MVAIPGDVALLVTLNLKAINTYATYYGFDTTLEEERLFALAGLDARVFSHRQRQRSGHGEYGQGRERRCSAQSLGASQRTVHSATNQKDCRSPWDQALPKPSLPTWPRLPVR